MYPIRPLEAIDYLVMGHLTCDITPNGLQIGGTAAYAALTARALGLRVGIVTSWGMEIPLEKLIDIPIINLRSEQSTTFENQQTSTGRVQTLFASALPLGYQLIPDAWRNTPIIHLAPVAQEIEPSIVRYLSSPLVGVTPQGWLRDWDSLGRVGPTNWIEASFVLSHSAAAVLSIEDVGRDEEVIEEMALACPVLAVTEAADGARVYWNGDVRRFRALEIEEVDAVGAGDIFAAAFFSRLYSTRDPWEAARFATQLASYSIARRGLDSTPTEEEIHACMVEVL